MLQGLKNVFIHALGGYTSNEYEQQRYEAQSSILKLILAHFNVENEQMYADREKFQRIWARCHREFDSIEKYLKKS